MAKKQVKTPNLSNEPPVAYFQGGTIGLHSLSERDVVPDSFQWVHAKWRCPAVHYRAVRSRLKRQGIRNSVPRWRDLKLALHDDREPHPYQTEALKSWHAGQRWGSIVLPTGAGKTFVALRAVTDCAVSTLVIVPTLVLVHQWYAILENAFQINIGLMRVSMSRRLKLRWSWAAVPVRVSIYSV